MCGGYGIETITDFGADDVLMIERGVVGGDDDLFVSSVRLSLPATAP